jgi:hypothetical protein
MSSHPDDTLIERFIIGALEGDDESAFLAHVGSCDACSDKLAAEARLELTLMDVARVSRDARVTPIRPSQRARLKAALPVVFAAAAAVALYVGRGSWLGTRSAATQESAGAAPVAVASCPNDARQLDCIAEAHRDGRRLEYPRGGALAALGTNPGLSVLVECGPPDAPIEGFETMTSALRSIVEGCIADNLNVQAAPVLSGHYTLHVALDAGGKVLTADPVIMLGWNNAPPPAYSPTIGCFEDKAKALHFPGNGKITRFDTEILFVWRE